MDTMKLSTGYELFERLTAALKDVKEASVNNLHIQSLFSKKLLRIFDCILP